MREPSKRQIENAISQFDIWGKVINHRWHGNGHINDTRLITVQRDDGQIVHFILQMMNTSVFTKPVELMENIIAVTKFIRAKVIARGGDIEREVVNVIPTKDGCSYYVDKEGNFWRLLEYISGATSYDSVDDPEIFKASAYAFGRFQNDLSDFPIDKLHETIPNFHNTESRYAAFEKSVEKDIAKRKSTCEREIDLLLERKPLAQYFNKLLAEKKIPLRVTHNDTKLNNVMIDDATHKGLCVIDLDTVMPGISCFDFGDAIRFGANTAVEDETDLSKVSLSRELFIAFTEGFIEGCGGRLTSVEIDSLYLGAMEMTYEVALRFLADYLDGDTYFRIDHPSHNLERARCQIALLLDMEKKRSEMEEVVQELKKKYKSF